jgi:hypothetical protein
VFLKGIKTLLNLEVAHFGSFWFMIMLIDSHEIVTTMSAKKIIEENGHVGFSVMYCIHIRFDILDEFFPFSFPEVLW